VLAGIIAIVLLAQAAPNALSAGPDHDAEPAPAAASPIPDCDTPGHAPDPRCNESLDGRAPPESSTSRRVAQAALAVPRAAARTLLLPVVEATESAERHQIFPWLRALTTSDDGKIGLRPEIQYASGFVPSIGAGLFYRRLPDPTSEVVARFKAGSADILRGEIAVRGPRRLGLILGALWDRRDDRLFAGIGNPVPGAPPPVESRYRGDIYRAEALWFTPQISPLVLTLRVGVEAREYDSDDVRGGPPIAEVYGAPLASCAARGLPSPCTDPALVPGFEIDRRLLYQRARLALNLRPRGRDASGAALGLEGSMLHGIAADPSRYARLGFDGVAAIGGTDRELLLKFLAAVVEPVGSAPVPFDDMVSPCGALGMRGLPDGLLRDRSGLVGTAEYRWLISSVLDASLFVDEGAVAGPWFANLSGEDFHTTVGAGLRLYGSRMPRYWEESSTQGVQVAYSPGHGVRIILSAALF
jgi:hypothetical protein